MFEIFYGYLRRRLGVLLGWGLFNMLIGGFMRRSMYTWVKQAAMQALVWGAIDVLLAGFAIHGASRKEQRFERNEIDLIALQKDIRSLQRILAVNIGLDILSAGSGVWVKSRFPAWSDRQGMGVGILVQGAWLFCFDCALALEIQNSWWAH